jgi:hypothetical protein
MLRVEARQGAPKDGFSPMERFQVFSHLSWHLLTLRILLSVLSRSHTLV